MTSHHIPYKDLNTLFLDAGNTLVSMDFVWVGEVLWRCGVECEIEELRRAEAAARPIVSAELERLQSTESQNTFAYYVRSILGKLCSSSVLANNRLDKVVREVLQILGAPGQNQRLWSFLLPGVRDALDILWERGFQLVVVSNSDGTVEDGLSRLGIRHYFGAVVDSYKVGFEKPDPRLFHHALQMSSADPERTLHIGDMYDVDVLGARSAGLHALLLDPFSDWHNVDCVRFPDLLSFATKIARAVT